MEDLRNKIEGKHKSIQDFVSRFSSLEKFKSWKIVDHWEASLCSIGFTKGDRLLYVSTNSYVDSGIDLYFNRLYDYDLERLDESQEDYYEVIEEGRGVSEEKLLEVMDSVKT